MKALLIALGFIALFTLADLFGSWVAPFIMPAFMLGLIGSGAWLTVRLLKAGN